MVDLQKRLEYLRQNQKNRGLFRAGLIGLSQSEYDELIVLIVTRRDQASELVKELGRLQIAARTEYDNRES